MSTPLSHWKKTKRRNIPDIVGKFFEKLGSLILKACSPSSGNLDLAIQKILTGVEVKGGDSNHSLRIPTEQLDRHLSQNLFLFPDMLENLVYCLFCYKNRKHPVIRGSKRRSSLSQCKDEYGVYLMLAENTDGLYIFDHRIILAMKKLFGAKKKKLPCDPEAEVILVKKSYLESFNTKNAKEIFSSLDLEEKDWAIRKRYFSISITVGLLSHKLRLKVVEVLPRLLMAHLDKALKTPKIGKTAKRTLVISSDFTINP